MSDIRQLMTAQELAMELSLSVETIWRYTRQRRIPFVELGNRQYRYDLNKVLTELANTPSTVSEEASAYETDRSFTYQDYISLPEEPGFRYEVLDGLLVKEPSPNTLHQRVCGRLFRTLSEQFQIIDPEGEVFIAPLDVVLSNDTIVQPDLFFIPSNKKAALVDEHIHTSPALIIEVLSPSSFARDRLRKMELYRTAGVLHYWIVDPTAHTLEAFALRGEHYALVAGGCDNEVFTHPEYPELALKLDDIWPC